MSAPGRGSDLVSAGISSNSRLSDVRLSAAPGSSFSSLLIKTSKQSRTHKLQSHQSDIFSKDSSQ